ncbi:alpha/beta fold hydrolase [Paraburkholderia rhynchosiae]|uniref:(E)-2-((N-methylformamido)methylene)succinate hydrolase n=1 Tax=Paraburkholderia rhynchosiae TaxID=487049 RepID=A0A2N7W6U6_9BURK|nr:alpha/beta fold hydrolase [Paraburkholderia rhynchosiae]PMS25118.1 alpha/beta hydrolase [Paraburkholderia rhynchosiae]CAB3715090.1 (E)-2-((N-methylformamido)methylene)succinate hydrolase [Paraburkholderia rhynchosiae]
MKHETQTGQATTHSTTHSTIDGTFDGTAYSVAGEGEALILIHGVGMNRRVWEPQVEALQGQFRVVSYDMLGHGASRLPAASPQLEEYAAQLLALVDHLDIETAHVVGHSMGSLVALEFALRYPSRVASVAALNAVYDRTPAQRSAVMQRAASLNGGLDQPSIDATIARWFDDPVPGHLAKAAQMVRSLLESVDLEGYARTYRLFASSDQAHVGRLTQLAMPALFMTGECDPNSSPAMSESMAAAAPLGRAEIIASERHMMNVTAPSIVNQRLLRFIRNVNRVSRGAAS